MSNYQNRFRILFMSAIVIALIIYGRQLYDRYVQTAVKPVFNNIQPAEINKLVIEGEEKQELKRQEKAWILKKEKAEYNADIERVETLLKELATFTKGDVVSVNKSKHEILGLGKRAVTFTAGEKEQTIYFGSANANGINVRLGGSNEAFVALGINDPFYPEDYRDLSVPVFTDENKIDEVSEISVNHGKTSISLKKTGKEWKIGEQTAKEERINYFISDLTTLKANDIKKGGKKPAGIPEIMVVVKEKGKERTTMFYKSDDTTYIGILTGNETLHYSIAAAYVNSLKKEEKDFVE